MQFSFHAPGRKSPPLCARRARCKRLELDGRLLRIDALHTETETARQIVLEHGDDYLMAVSINQPTVQRTVQVSVPDPAALFFAR